MPRRADPNGRTNRSDLPATGGAPQIPGGLDYGEGKALRDAQALIPRTSSEMAAAAGQGAGPGAGPGAPAGAPADLLAMSQAYQPGVPGLTQPSTRPAEPVTAGIDIGAGPGRSAVPRVVQPAPDPDAYLWARYLPAFELMASSPNSSRAFRQFYRRLRASVPPEVANARRTPPQAT